jgi:hypothetical protein
MRFVIRKEIRRLGDRTSVGGFILPFAAKVGDLGSVRHESRSNLCQRVSTPMQFPVHAYGVMPAHAHPGRRK